MCDLELYALNFGVYPRRVIIYLGEKGIIGSDQIKITPVDLGGNAPGKPRGTSPILRLPDGSFIKQSVAILEYLEDICDNPQQKWQRQLAAAASGPSMRGSSAEEKAQTRSVLGLADEATALFGWACHKGSGLFASLEPSDPLGARMALESSKKNLKLIDEWYEGDARFDEDAGAPPPPGTTTTTTTTRRHTTIADCVLFSLLQFAREFYSLDLLQEPELPNLRRFYDWFNRRESAAVDADLYPKELKELAGNWSF